MSNMLDLSVTLAMGLLGASVVLVAMRLAVGPTLADRALALDLLGFLAVAFAAVFVLRTGQAALFDPAMALALVAFLATVALARFSLQVDEVEKSVGDGAGSTNSPTDRRSPKRDRGDCDG